MSYAQDHGIILIMRNKQLIKIKPPFNLSFLRKEKEKQKPLTYLLKVECWRISNKFKIFLLFTWSGTKLKNPLLQ